MEPNQMFSVASRSAIVTGAASGIGLAVAETLAEGGARVTMLDMDERRLVQQVERLRSAGHQVRGRTLDVTDKVNLNAAFDEAAALQGGLDIVFANAGIDPGPGFVSFSDRSQRLPAHAIENYEQARWDRVVDISLNAVLYSIQASARLMKPKGKGRVIVTTSTAAVRVSPGVGAAYMAAKCGATHLVRTAALELARYGILINAIAPGPFVTNIAGGHMSDPSIQKALAEHIPLKRVASTEEIKGLALLLASDAGSFITGQQIVIDGGYTVGRAD
ncbi:SDR family NAD(P)-dependent oxidoreductase [Variovorax sp. GB1P17]|uniref:SDR family NAD(P)-dependent oxidoreductase n=1 Tax=Variovorax sp. GB1P17 TaxID=3443740 RepID=UPI003F487570